MIKRLHPDYLLTLQVFNGESIEGDKGIDLFLKTFDAGTCDVS